MLVDFWGGYGGCSEVFKLLDEVQVLYFLCVSHQGVNVE